MEYNTKREQVRFTDYGRNVHKMIAYAMKIQDREKRTAAARQIVEVMSLVNPAVKDNADYQHMLWDHLMMASDFKLDVDTPFPIARSIKEPLRPNRIQRNGSNIRFRHYGRSVEAMMKKVLTMPEGEERSTLIRLIGNQMKLSYIEWNDNSVTDELIISQINAIAGKTIASPQEVKLVNIKDRSTLSHVVGQPPAASA